MLKNSLAQDTEPRIGERSTQASRIALFRFKQLSLSLLKWSILLGWLVSLLTACQQPSANQDISLLPTESPKAAEAVLTPQSQPTVVLVMKTLTNPFFVAMEKGARQAEAEQGINLLVRTASEETSIEQQISIVEALTQEGVDAIVIAPGDSIELIPALKKAQDAGIFVINIDNQLDPTYATEMGLESVPFISVDNEHGAYLSAKVLSEQITTPGKVAILEGIRSAKNAESRKQGALRAFAENPNITDIILETANWKIDEGYAVTSQLLGRHPDVRAIFCANDMMALGAIKYLEESGQLSQIKVAGFDALEEARVAVQQGKLVATVDQKADQQGYLGVMAAIKALKGEPVDLKTVVDVEVITGN